MTYDELNNLFTATEGMSIERIIRTKSSDRKIVHLGSMQFVTLESLALNEDGTQSIPVAELENTINEHLPHCLRTVAGWQVGLEASKDE